MVEKTNLNGKRAYRCDKCGLLYKDENMAEKCENWCRKYKSCNLEYSKHAIKPLTLLKDKK